MSAVFANAKNLYKKAFLLEVVLLGLALLPFYFWAQTQIMSYLCGAIVAFLPQIAFFSYFSYSQQKNGKQNKAKLLYCSEGIKIVLTIALFVLVFLFFDVEPIGLFIGYFLAIALNNLLPILFTLWNKTVN